MKRSYDREAVLYICLIIFFISTAITIFHITKLFSVLSLITATIIGVILVEEMLEK
ncbi:MAG TPA: hypothetical protein PKD15_00680 [Candidatus Saccharibacteria bacterium]|nr:hypothetical protein [Candidatus Saccharibacteria bacterium]